MEQVRYGVIGLGMGANHLRNLISGRIPNGVATAVCDIRDDRLEFGKSICANHPEVSFYKDYKEMLASGKIDAVIIATPHYLHPVIGIEAMDAGIHVLSEKPIGVYAKKVYELMAKANEHPELAFGVMFNQRTNGYFQKMREIVQSGELGELKRCVWIITDWYRTQTYYNSGGWRATWAGEGGGVLMNQCPHNLDLWQWIFGMPKKIFASCAMGKYHDIEVEDDVMALAEYENGATGAFFTSTGEAPGTNRLEITGSKGKLVYENEKLIYTKLSEDEREYTFTSKETGTPPESTTIELESPNGTGEQHAGILKNFTNHILYNEPLLAPGMEGILGLSIANAMMLSSWKNEWVEVQNDGEEFWTYLQDKIKHSRIKEEPEIAANMDSVFGNP